MESIRKDHIIDDYIIDIKKIDVEQDLQSMTWPFCLSTELWKKYNEHTHSVDLHSLRKIKYFGNDESELSEQVSGLPEDIGGIYLYVIENSVIPIAGSYIMYVGRARKTNSENLKKRAKSHFYQYRRHEENERLERVFDKWNQHLYFLYLPVNESDDIIDLIEDELILALTPPCNKDYPSPKIRRKLSAFNYS